MERRVERQYIDKWLDEHSPNALAKLSVECGVVATSIAKIRYGWVPKRAGSRIRLAGALGVDEDTLFPFMKEDAS